jgi:hypothetical protein
MITPIRPRPVPQHRSPESATRTRSSSVFLPAYLKGHLVRREEEIFRASSASNHLFLETETDGAKRSALKRSRLIKTRATRRHPGERRVPLRSAELELLLQGVRADDPIAQGRLLDKLSRQIRSHARREFHRARLEMDRVRIAVEGKFIKQLRLVEESTHAVRILRPLVRGEVQAHGYSVDDLAVEIQVKLVRLAKQYRAGRRSFKAFANKYLAQRAGTVRRRWVRTFRIAYNAQAEAAVNSALNRVLADAAIAALPDLRRFLDNFEGALKGSPLTQGMARVFRCMRENPETGKGSTDVKERELAAGLGMSPPAFARTKARLRRRLLLAMPETLRRRYLRFGGDRPPAIA